MSDNKEKAKKIFFDYACNTFYMAHDGELEEYKKIGVSAAQEAEWRREYISFWVSQLSIDDLTAVNRLGETWAGEALPDLIKMAGQGDGYAKLWYANAIWKLANGASISATMRDQAIKTAINLWQSLVQRPIELSDNHKAEISPNMKPLDASTPEEYVLNYAKRKLAEAKTKGKS
jgi:hypothetical protein